MKHIAILGRQPALGIAELEAVYDQVAWFGDYAALIDSDQIDLSRLGGSQKIGRVILTLPHLSWDSLSTKIIRHYTDSWRHQDGKLTLGLSAYGFTKLKPTDVQRIGLKLKQSLRSRPGSLRLIPNQTVELSTATSHHNKLGLSPNKIELLIVASSKEIIVAESIGAQNITAYAARDQARPKRDAFVGMLPPKLAQIMLNLALGPDSNRSDGSPLGQPAILDPFCGTGVVLQEALLMGLEVFGSDLNPKMVDYSSQNLDWLIKQLGTHPTGSILTIRQGDATDYQWVEAPALTAVVAETYLGQPFSAPPSETKLTEVKATCDGIISAFLRNIGSQVSPHATFCLAVPAWRRLDGSFAHLPLVDQLGKLGFRPREFKTVSKNDLLYYRADQAVARELLVFSKA